MIHINDNSLGFSVNLKISLNVKCKYKILPMIFANLVLDSLAACFELL